MKRFIFILDDDSSKVLDKYPNKSEAIRQALQIYNNDISTDTVAGMRASFRETKEEMGKVKNYLAALVALTTQIADKTKVTYDPSQFSDWGA